MRGSEDIYLVGCPRIDLVARILDKQTMEMEASLNEGVGASIDINKPFIIISQHPVTTEYGLGEKQITETLKAVKKTNIPAIVLWPNSDAGSEDIARGIRK